MKINERLLKENSQRKVKEDRNESVAFLFSMRRKKKVLLIYVNCLLAGCRHLCNYNFHAYEYIVLSVLQGEEATFDYNYVRVFGAAAKKCVCGSPQCRGYIGGDPQNTESIVQGDSDDEYPEPIMLYEDGGMVHPLNQLGGIITSGYESSMDQSAADIRKSRTSVDNGDPNTKVPTSDLPVDIIPQIKDDGSISMSATQQEIVAEEVLNASEKSEISSPSKPLSKLHDDDANRSRTKKSNTIDKRLHPLVKQSRSSGSIKKSSSINMDKVQWMAHKSQMVLSRHRKAVEGSSSGRIEAGWRISNLPLMSELIHGERYLTLSAFVVRSRRET